MGILPLQFKDGESRLTHQFDGTETFDIFGLMELTPGRNIEIGVVRKNGHKEKISFLCRVDTQNELEYLRHGGILQYVLRNLHKS